MRRSQASLTIEEIAAPMPELRLVIAHEPRPTVFLKNLRDLIRPPRTAPLELVSAPAAFWPDVFVNRRLPWRRFAQSGIYHILAIVAIWEASQFLALQTKPVARSAFAHSEVVYYSPSEYLPPLDTRRSNSAHARKAAPEYAPQPIISLPPEADNRSQTIVAPPKVKLDHDVPLPNMVAMAEESKMPIGPAPIIPASQTSRLAPNMERSVIAPPPDVQTAARNAPHALQSDIIAPPPAVEASSTRRLGDLNIGRSAVIAPAPQLTLDAQRPRRSSSGLSPQAGAPQVIAPPPSLPTTGRARSGGSVVALNLHPAVGAPPVEPAGNRRGTFAATPGGHRGASGAPGASAENGKESGTGAAGTNSSKLPSGLYVGKATNSSPVTGDPSSTNLTALVNPKLLGGGRSSMRAMQPGRETKITEEERAVFGERKFYSLSLNMPNLNSAGGSWIIHFAALKPDSNSRQAAQDTASDLSAPAATRKVDPAYPLELMRQNVSGTVLLYAVIHADGTVGGVRILRSVDEHLDQFATEAITKWKFQPATKNGAPVDVEATFSIPFHPAKTASSF